MESGNEQGLVRAIGVRGLTASIVNTTIGAGIFVLPALVARDLGSAAPLAYLACGLAMTFVVASFAMAGSRVSLTGGIYAYVEVAFGPLIGFLTGFLVWLSSLLAAASVASALAAGRSSACPRSGLWASVWCSPRSRGSTSAACRWARGWSRSSPSPSCCRSCC